VIRRVKKPGCKASRKNGIRERGESRESTDGKTGGTVGGKKFPPARDIPYLPTEKKTTQAVLRIWAKRGRKKANETARQSVRR